MSEKVSPQSPTIANNEGPGMAYRYERSYQSLYSKLSEQERARVLAVKGNLNIIDNRVEGFVKSVIALAESDKEL